MSTTEKPADTKAQPEPEEKRTARAGRMAERALLRQMIAERLKQSEDA